MKIGISSIYVNGCELISRYYFIQIKRQNN